MGLRSFCPHCHGEIGRDCFNVEECGIITQQQSEQAPYLAETIVALKDEIQILEAKVFDLERRLEGKSQ